MPDITQEELDALKRKAAERDAAIANANEKVRQANNIVSGLKKVQESDPELADYLMRVSRGESARPPMRKTEFSDEDDLDPTDRKVIELSEKVDTLTRLLENSVRDGMTEREALKAKLRKQELVSTVAPDFDKYKDKMQELAKNAPGILESPDALEILYMAASAEDKAVQAVEKERQMEEQRKLEMADAWSPAPTGLGDLDVTPEDLENIEVDDLFEKYASDAFTAAEIRAEQAAKLASTKE